MKDYDKLFDFIILSKHAFLKTHSDMTEAEYEEMARNFAVEVLAKDLATRFDDIKVDKSKLIDNLENLRKELNCSVVQLKDYVLTHTYAMKDLIRRSKIDE